MSKLLFQTHKTKKGEQFCRILGSVRYVQFIRFSSGKNTKSLFDQRNIENGPRKYISLSCGKKLLAGSPLVEDINENYSIIDRLDNHCLSSLWTFDTHRKRIHLTFFSSQPEQISPTLSLWVLDQGKGSTVTVRYQLSTCFPVSFWVA